ncbi:MAG: gamma-glutamyltransferase [Caulobacter sp.]|nr:gamma-glutamyltransferase [Caulobacter sp.]
MFAVVAAILSLTVPLAPAPAFARAAPKPVAERALTAGAVASPDRYGALAAQEILRKGGNAVDAAVATAFALAVTYPEAGNLGGGGFMTLYVDGKPYFLDYRETAPAAATAGMYLDDKGQVIAGRSLVGNAAVGVPGTVRGMAMAHKRFGKLPWAQVLAPAVRYAREGFLVTPQLIGNLEEAQAPFVGVTNFHARFGTLKAGETFRQAELAATLERIAKGGDAEFYTGKTADLLVAQMARGPRKGLMTKADLAAYKAVWREPIQADWRGFRVITAPPPSSGGIALLQLLMMKQDAAPLFKGVALNSPQYVHLVAEMEKRVFADRAEYLGDPDFWKVPVSNLIDPAYVARRAREIDPGKPSPTPAVKPGLEKPQTTHFSIVDRWGNAVSNTYTLNGWFGSGVVVEGAGFLLNDEMDDFSAKPGAPNMFGVVGGDANAIAPGKRPLSSMTPTILLRDGKVAMVIGTPGGSRIFTSVFQVLADVYDFDLPLGEAQKATRFHHQLLPENVIFDEPYAPFPSVLRAGVEARGYTIERGFVGDIEAIQVIDGTPVPGPDPRARGVGLVVR